MSTLIDRNGYYGGACASLNLEDLYKHFNRTDAPPANLGRSRDWNIDLVPKFIMSQGTRLFCDLIRGWPDSGLLCVQVWPSVFVCGGVAARANPKNRPFPAMSRESASLPWLVAISR